MNRVALIFLLLLSCVIVVNARTWTDLNGKTVEAEFVSVNFGMVTLKTPAGKILKISQANLCAEDQAFVKDASKKEPASKTTLSFSSNTEPEVVIDPVKGDPEVVKQMVPGQVFRRVAKGETGISYHVYTPTGFDVAAPAPLIVSFSPGGSGMQMVNSMKSSAEKAGWVLIGCNDLKNKMEKPELGTKMEDEVLDDIFSVIPHNPQRVYLSGLSGGALRSYNLSARRTERITGIIAYGGWLGGDEYAPKGDYCKYMAVAIVNGDNDKAANSWVAKDEGKLKRSKCHVQVFNFPGGHEIGPSETIDKAMAWLKEDWEKSGCKRTKCR